MPSVLQTGRPAGATLAAAVLLAGCGHLLIKYGVTAAAPANASLAARVAGWLLAPAVMLGLLIYGSGTVFWILTVSRREISYVYPITAVNYALVGIAGAWLFGEPVSLWRWLGIFVVMLGVALMQTTTARSGS